MNVEPTNVEPMTERPRAWRGLSAKFLALTVASVMAIELLILVPSVANFWQSWVMGKLEQSRAALGVLDQTLGDDMLTLDLLEAFDAEAITLRNAERTASIARPGEAVVPDITILEGELGPRRAIQGAWAQLFDHDEAMLIGIEGMPDREGRRVGMVVDTDPLRAAMLVYMRNIVLISLLIAVVTALLIFLAVRGLLIRPIQRMTAAMGAFGAAPNDATRIIAPSARHDEVGLAERRLADMQRELHSTLGQQRHLAELGLAVSKINHDMRNILASAQLVSDRLAEVDDPLVQRVSPRLVRAIDRAVAYSEGVLEYGRAGEAVRERTRFAVAALLEEVAETAVPDNDTAIRAELDCSPELTVNADREQMLRVLLNLSRNAVEALREAGGGTLFLRARGSNAEVRIEVADDGPGIPEAARERLFSAFGASTKKRGSGLGLAIAREIVEAHGGTIALKPDRGEESGACFTITIPEAA